MIFSQRRFAATPAQLFDAFCDPDQLARWWGPKDFRLTFETFEPRVGGTWRFVMHAPDGSGYPNLKHFTEVNAERIAFRHVQEGHDFVMTMRFVAEGAGTQSSGICASTPSMRRRGFGPSSSRATRRTSSASRRTWRRAELLLGRPVSTRSCCDIVQVSETIK
ncbi:MAG: hypothetical protein HC794_09600 [Nitrospiraceae bacterium]|nr:hypothetical protein [Nitrospiraceae bacterium]